jgi:hypothetical protein
MEMLEEAWAEHGVYSDPTAEVHGRQALSDHIAGFRAQMQGAVLSLTSAVDVHHRQHLRFTWKIANPSGETLAAGMDYGELDDEGRLVRIVGFFGPFSELGD